MAQTRAGLSVEESTFVAVSARDVAAQATRRTLLVAAVATLTWLLLVVHAPTKIAGNRPITIGYDFGALSRAPELAGSWAPPLLFERIGSDETPPQKGASQLRRISKELQPLGSLGSSTKH